jgi:hypothetical protein
VGKTRNIRAIQVSPIFQLQKTQPKRAVRGKILKTAVRNQVLCRGIKAKQGGDREQVVLHDQWAMVARK